MLNHERLQQICFKRTKRHIHISHVAVIVDLLPGIVDKTTYKQGQLRQIVRANDNMLTLRGPKHGSLLLAGLIFSNVRWKCYQIIDVETPGAIRRNSRIVAMPRLEKAARSSPCACFKGWR